MIETSSRTAKTGKRSTFRWTAIVLIACVASAARGGQEQGDADGLERIAALAESGSVEDVATALEGALADGSLVLGDLQALFFESAPEVQVTLARAARGQLNEENIRRNHAAWHPQDRAGERLDETRAFLHYRFLFFEGTALLELGRAEEAVQRLSAIAEHSPRTPVGLSVYPYEGQLAKAYVELGEHAEALECITPLYAIGGQAWMRPTLEAAYVGAGLEQDTLQEYLVRKRAELAIEMPAFAGTDYDGRSVGFDEVRGDVTVITTWFPGCYGCRLELPFLQELEDRYRGRGLRIVAVETTRQTETARAYRQEHYGFATFPFLENGPPGAEVIESQLGANGNGTFLIGKDNKVVLAWGGWGEHLEAELEQRVLEELDRL